MECVLRVVEFCCRVAWGSFFVSGSGCFGVWFVFPCFCSALVLLPGGAVALCFCWSFCCVLSGLVCVSGGCGSAVCFCFWCFVFAFGAVVCLGFLKRRSLRL